MAITRRAFLKSTLAGGTLLAFSGGVSTARAAITPYDSKVGMWHWNSKSVGEHTIRDAALALRVKAPHVRGLYVKTHQGVTWQGEFDDQGSALAVTGVDAIKHWVDDLTGYGIEFHAWCAVEGTDAQAEASRMIDVASVPRVRSFVLDVEAGSAGFRGDAQFIKDYMRRIRASVGPEFHIGIAADTRRLRWESIFFEDWLAYVDSIHPFCYWDAFHLTPEATLDRTYADLSGIKLPIYPLFEISEPDQMESAVRYATNTCLAGSVSWFRFSSGITPAQYEAIDQTVALVERQFG